MRRRGEASGRGGAGEEEGGFSPGGAGQCSPHFAGSSVASALVVPHSRTFLAKEPRSLLTPEYSSIQVFLKQGDIAEVGKIENREARNDAKATAPGAKQPGTHFPPCQISS